MTVKLDIGPESLGDDKLPEPSQHVLNIKAADGHKLVEAHKGVSLDLKEEIRHQKNSSGRICIVGESTRSKQGLGRMPMVAGAMLVILILNLIQLPLLGKSKGEEALAIAGEAFTSLQDAGTSVISGGSDMTSFEEAQQLFKEAEEKSEFLLKYQSKWLPAPEQVQSLQNMLDSGYLMAEVGAHLTAVKTSFENLPSEGSLTDYLKQISVNDLEPAAEKVAKIEELISVVDMSSTPYQTKFIELKEKLGELSNLLSLWVESKDEVYTILGDRYPQKYLVLLMNNDEMRPGGGFIGSYLLIDLDEGRLTNMSFHDIYELDNLFYEQIEMPLHELKSLTSLWRMRDSNIFPDFPTSAKKAMWFLEHEGGPGVDGVLAVNLSAAQSMLRASGPIKVPSLSKEISEESFPTVMSTLVEAKVFGADSPKKILGELISEFTKVASNAEVKQNIAINAFAEANKKQILFYHKDINVQNLLASMGLDNSIPQLSTLTNDFFMPIFTNIGANKTDRYMTTDISHATKVMNDDSIVNTVSITRTHTFTRDTLAWMKNLMAGYNFTAWNKDIEGVLGNAPNHTGIRIYLPQNAQILETTGILRDEIQFFYDPYQDVSYYYVDQTVNPAESETFSITYSLPWEFGSSYDSYTAQIFKQPGLKQVTIKKTLETERREILSSNPVSQSNEAFLYEGNFANDLDFNLLLK